MMANAERPAELSVTGEREARCKTWDRCVEDQGRPCVRCDPPTCTNCERPLGDQCIAGGFCSIVCEAQHKTKWGPIPERPTPSDAGEAVREIERTLRNMREFVIAHHADQPMHLLLHALTVDIPDGIDNALAALAALTSPASPAGEREPDARANDWMVTGLETIAREGCTEHSEGDCYTNPKGPEDEECAECGRAFPW